MQEFPINPITIILIVIIFFVIIAFLKTVRIVPQKQAFVVERLGKYSATLGGGVSYIGTIY